MKWCSLLCPLVVMQAGIGGVWGHVKRGSEQNATLYAYGANASAWPIAYGLSDGLLYIAQNPDDTAADLTPMYWGLPSITDECWIVNGTFVNGTRAGSLYIRPETDNSIGVLPYARAAAVDGIVTGFALFASQLVYNNNTELEAQFWASSTDTDGVYALVWVEDESEVGSGSFPVVVKGSES
ncbi:hypothetical protein BO94DRAFT_613737 [Aspergillus sclerotioniger CBS 115572]|uniref:Uncharacterized protein n=1 Tax=Aspergillus sclerotioniger CBS 115572 TaxID=1450535 RepID=A0A317UXP7_9EURO|nr:hypothetical protein BO94DRAFT_613737 [Aspergillus sclerotioniger CBS 115572]PWY66515.1 hypothetical protein BO94DRAFT_613737 [Aspergillus sclerotioniger CBS 115572]